MPPANAKGNGAVEISNMCFGSVIWIKILPLRRFSSDLVSYTHIKKFVAHCVCFGSRIERLGRV